MAIVRPIPMTSLDSATLTGAYQQLGNPLPNACQFLRIHNTSGADLIVSFDGVTDHDIAESGSEVWLSITLDPIVVFKAGTTIYVKGAADTGLIYLIGYYC
jgi:hypothetical protein